MATDHIRYDLLAQDALRGVVRTVLTDAAQKGLPGEHHFKITFRSTAAGVRLSERLRVQYPKEMTIVLQHQFWDLVVTEEAFEVGLSFGGIPERVAVPFAAVTAFFDPAVQFGFQFETLEAAATSAAESGPPSAAEESTAPAGRLRAGEAAPGSAPALAAAVPAPSGAPTDTAGSGAGGEIVRLDRFRKK